MEKYLYHATYIQHLPSILQKGLGNTRRKYWDHLGKGVVYLATDDDIAYSFAEVAMDDPDGIENTMLGRLAEDDIIVLEINTATLDSTKFEEDTNIDLDEDEEAYTFAYRGIIQKQSINRIITYSDRVKKLVDKYMEKY